MLLDPIDQMIRDFERSPQASDVDAELVERIKKVNFAKLDPREQEALTQGLLRQPNSRERLTIEEVLEKRG